jgi:rod shape-determining protein MreC
VGKSGIKVSFWRDYLILFFALSLSLGALFFANDARKLGGIHTFCLELIGRMTEPLAWVRTNLNLADENRMLRRQNAVLQLRNAQLAEAWYENSRLRQLLGFKMTAPYDLVAATVTGRQEQSGAEALILNAGADQGIKANMTVVSADGLVGRVVSVSSGFCIVQTLDDRTFRCAAMVQRSRLQGMFQWSGYNAGILTGIYLSGDVRKDDVVVTAGTSSIFVPGLKIGMVSFIDEAESGMFRKIYVKPKVDMIRLEEVYIIRSETGERPR